MIMRVPIWPIVLIAVSTSSCDEVPAPTAPSSSTVKVSGRVVGYQSRSPAAGAVVRFSREPLNGPFLVSEATTGSDGVYVLTVASTGGFNVTVDGSLAGSAYLNGTSFPGDSYTSGGTCVTRYGLIVDSRSLRPIPAATVGLSGKVTATDVNGWY
jgi:hypothetical protein